MVSAEDHDAFRKRCSSSLRRCSHQSALDLPGADSLAQWDRLDELTPSFSLCKAWVAEMAEYMKGLDANHLLTLGEEGFYSSFKAGLSANPGGLGELSTVLYSPRHSELDNDESATVVATGMFAYLAPAGDETTWSMPMIHALWLTCTGHGMVQIAHGRLKRGRTSSQTTTPPTLTSPQSTAGQTIGRCCGPTSLHCDRRTAWDSASCICPGSDLYTPACLPQRNL